MALPQYGGPEDILAVVRYLKNKATGATAAEMRKVLETSVADPRKLATLEAWGFIERAGERYMLSRRGWDVARDPKSLQTAAAEALSDISAYREALEMAHHRDLDLIDTGEVGAFWHQHFSSELGTDSEKSISTAAAAFFRLAAEAGLGAYVLGRRGAATRIDFDRQRLAAFVEAGPLTPPWSEEDETSEEVTEHSGAGQDDTVPERSDDGKEADPESSLTTKRDFRVFISHGRNQELVDQVETVLGLAGIESEVAVKEESTAIPVPEKVLSSMRKCEAGIMIVSVDEADTGGPFSVNDNVLIEIGAAFVLYDRKVVLVWDKRLPVPSNLQGLYRCEFEGDELGWGAGVKLMKAIQQFK